MIWLQLALRTENAARLLEQVRARPDEPALALIAPAALAEYRSALERIRDAAALELALLDQEATLAMPELPPEHMAAIPEKPAGYMAEAWRHGG